MYKILSNDTLIAKDFNTIKEAKEFIRLRGIHNSIILQQ